MNCCITLTWNNDWWILLFDFNVFVSSFGNSLYLDISHFYSNVTQIVFIIYFYHLTIDNDESVSSNIRVKFYLKYMVLWKCGGILLITVSPKTMENTNGHYYYCFYGCQYHLYFYLFLFLIMVFIFIKLLLFIFLFISSLLLSLSLLLFLLLILFLSQFTLSWLLIFCSYYYSCYYYHQGYCFCYYFYGCYFYSHHHYYLQLRHLYCYYYIVILINGFLLFSSRLLF